MSRDAIVYGQYRYKHDSPILYGMAEYFDKMTSLDALYKAFQLSKRESDWKVSVQRYEMNILRNLMETRRQLLCREYKPLRFAEFDLNERGKTRHIKSLHISDRVVQRSICDNVLNPVLEKKLIYDNGASIKNKGITFTRNRLQCHLERFIRKHGNNGYILKLDFSKFFDNIPHDKIIEKVAECIDDVLVLELFSILVDSFKIDISYLTDKHEYDSKPFNSLDHSKVPKEKLTGEYFLNRSVGIGSQISQIIGAFYPTEIDTYCKTVKRCKYYGRYMDDIYIIHESKEFLKSILVDIKEISDKLGLFINDRKTTITELKYGFTFLQIRYSVTDSGHIVKRMNPKAFTRERRKLKAYRRMLDEGRTTRKKISDDYQSWKGNAKQFDSHNSVRRMDALYTNLFVDN